MTEKKDEALIIYFRGTEVKLYEALRKVAYDTKQNMNVIIKEAITKELKKLKYI
jgi:hypothetical protein